MESGTPYYVLKCPISKLKFLRPSSPGGWNVFLAYVLWVGLGCLLNFRQHLHPNMLELFPVKSTKVLKFDIFVGPTGNVSGNGFDAEGTQRPVRWNNGSIAIPKGAPNDAVGKVRVRCGGQFWRTFIDRSKTNAGVQR